MVISRDPSRDAMKKPTVHDRHAYAMGRDRCFLRRGNEPGLLSADLAKDNGMYRRVSSGAADRFTLRREGIRLPSLSSPHRDCGPGTRAGRDAGACLHPARSRGRCPGGVVCEHVETFLAEVRSHGRRRRASVRGVRPAGLASLRRAGPQPCPIAAGNSVRRRLVPSPSTPVGPGSACGAREASPGPAHQFGVDGEPVLLVDPRLRNAEGLAEVAPPSETDGRPLRVARPARRRVGSLLARAGHAVRLRRCRRIANSAARPATTAQAQDGRSAARPKPATPSHT